MYINTNTSALNAMRHLTNANNRLDITYERLASGKRINSAADDAAGLQISSRLTSQINGLNRVDKNIADGISYAQVAEGALHEVTSMLQRMYQLSIQSSNGTNTDSDRNALNQEFQELKKEIDRVAANTHIFGQYPLLGAASAPLVTDINNFNPFPPHINGGNYSGKTSDGINFLGLVPKGTRSYVLDVNSNAFDGDFQVFTRSGKHIAGTPLSDITWTSNNINSIADLTNKFLTCKNGFEEGAIYDTSDAVFGNNSRNFNGTHVVTSDDRDTNNNGITDPSEGNTDNLNITEVVIGDGIDEDLLIFSTVTNGSPNNDIFQVILNKDEEKGFQVFVSTTEKGDDGFITIEKTPSSTANLGIACTDISTYEEAQESISYLQDAINQVGEYRSHYGAKINVLQSASRSAMNQHENLSAARSQIQDTDYASETAKLAKEQILQQAAQTVLSQANLQNDLVLSLLK